MTDKETKDKKFTPCYEAAALVMNDVPIDLLKEFTSDVKVKYGNIRWVKLMNIMEKAKAYDNMMVLVGEDEPIQQQEEVKEQGELLTMGGLRK